MYSFLWPLDTRAALRNGRNAHGQVPVNWDFPEKRLDCAHLGYRRGRERAQVVLDGREVLRHVRISNRDDRSPFRGMVEDTLQ